MDAKHNINDLSVTSLKLGSFDDISLPEMLSLIKKKFQTDTSFEWDKIFDWAAIKYPIIDPFQYKKDTISDVLKILQSALSKDECLFYLKSISHLMSKINHKITFGSSDFLIVQEELIRWFPENKDLRREHFNDFNKFTNKNYTHLEALAQYKKYESINHIKAWLNWFIGNHTTRNNSEGLSFLVDYSYKNEDK